MTYLLFTVALSLSAVAAWYAIAGLTAIFAAAVIPIMIMGSLLEASKLVVASWLYRNWKDIPTLLKSYFTVALVILMLLTSMGIFGFLSKAHLDQAVPSGDVQSKLSLLDEKIKTEKENINASRKELNQLDVQVEQTISRTTDSSGTDRAIAIRRGQQKDRARILNEIGSAQSKIAKLQEERQPIASEVRKVEAEVGPIKYIAALIYGDNLDESLLEKAVRIVTIMIVLVFDPLAVLLLVAANWTLKKEQGLLVVDNEIVNVGQKPWDHFFNKPPAEDFPERAKEELVEDDIIEQPSSINVMEQMVEQLSQPKVEEPVVNNSEESSFEEASIETVEEEIPEINVDEPTNDWSPELFSIKRGDVVTQAEYPDTKDVPPKTASFMRKTIDFLKSPGVSVKTIEKEVDELQKKSD